MRSFFLAEALSVIPRENSNERRSETFRPEYASLGTIVWEVSGDVVDLGVFFILRFASEGDDSMISRSLNFANGSRRWIWFESKMCL